MRRGPPSRSFTPGPPPYPVLPTDLYADHEPMQRAAEASSNATVGNGCGRRCPSLVEVRASARMDHPAPALLCAAIGVQLLVVGSRGRRRVRRARAGVRQRAVPLPRAVFRRRRPQRRGGLTHGRVVVGVDGSPSSEQALAWARVKRTCGTAPERRARLDDAGGHEPGRRSLVGDPGALQRASRALLEDMGEGLGRRARRRPSRPDAAVRRRARRAGARAGADAERRSSAPGGGRPPAALLGSVSRQCALTYRAPPSSCVAFRRASM